MKDIFLFLRRFAAPYKLYVSLSAIFNFLTAFLTIFSFAFIIPILQMLFGLSKGHYTYIEPTFDNLKDSLINNFYYYNDRIIALHGPSVALAFLTAVFIGMTLLKTTIYYLGDYFLIPMKNGVIRDIRNQLYNKILSLPIGFFTNERKGDIMSRFSNDVAEIEVSVTASLFSIIKFPIMIIVCLAAMLIVSWQLTIFVFIMIPLIGGLMGLIGKKLKTTSKAAQEALGQINSTIEETIGGLRVVKAFDAERQMSQRFSRETNLFFRIGNALNRRISLAHPLSELLGTIAIGAVLWFGGTLIINGSSSIDAANFIFYLAAFYSIINPAKELAKTHYTLKKGMGALERVDAVLDAENPITDPTDPVAPATAENHKSAIRFKDVQFSYESSERPVIDHVDINVKPGQTVAIVGQSGSGKSTLVDLLPRFWDVDGGAIEVDGHNVRDYRVADLRAMMGNVNQEAILFNDTFFNNIAFGAENATREDVERAARIANAHDFIMETPDGYDTLVGDRGCRLSGGQRQRISIARAILKNPPILILDEATSALDTESERLVQEALEHLMKNRTTIVIAHRLSTVVNADLICVMQDGKIVERGTHSQLMECDGVYRRLVEMQQV
ncbi:MAG: ATP-binding cassette domain-containing protein [Muribaculaceae bacterium]|nr:ATP-binding cassette domain-containing protein [Muribaculaceae bacterium]